MRGGPAVCADLGEREKRGVQHAHGRREVQVAVPGRDGVPEDDNRDWVVLRLRVGVQVDALDDAAADVLRED